MQHSIAWWPTLIVLAIATFTDLRSRRIPNWLVLPFMLAGIVVSGWLHGWTGIGQSFAGLALGAVVLGVLHFMGGMGMGGRETMRRYWRLDRSAAVDVCTGHHRHGGRRHGPLLGRCRWLFRRTFSRNGRPSLQRQEARYQERPGVQSRQSAPAQDAIRAGHRNWNACLFLCPLRTT